MGVNLTAIPPLQQVTDSGSTTTNNVTINGITLGGNIISNVASLFVKPGATHCLKIVSNGITLELSGGSNPLDPNVSAILDIRSTGKGALIPRMTTTQKNAIGSPTEGLQVYDLTLHKICVYNGTTWETVTSI